MVGSERRNSVVVMFMGRQQNASCSWGGNRMRRVHREGLDGTGDRNEAWRTAQRRKRPCVRPAMFETGSCSSGGVWRTAKRRNGPPTVETGVLLIGRGVAYRKTTKRTCVGALQTKRGSCSSGGVWRTAKWRQRTSYGRNGGPIDREGCGVPQNGEMDLLRSKRGSC